tara:strand:- start:1353 stop:1700 length:348 start_codon:yes stop_codon:yes gene_type:complete
MRLILIFSLGLCASCSSNPDAEAHRLALWNFHYEADKVDEYRIYDRIDRPFFGDCEDFAFSLQKVIGGDVWYIDQGKAIAHAALVKDNWVYDSIQKRPVSKSRYNGDFKYIMSAE